MAVRLLISLTIFAIILQIREERKQYGLHYSASIEAMYDTNKRNICIITRFQ